MKKSNKQSGKNNISKNNGPPSSFLDPSSSKNKSLDAKIVHPFVLQWSNVNFKINAHKRWFITEIVNQILPVNSNSLSTEFLKEDY